MLRILICALAIGVPMTALADHTQTHALGQGLQPQHDDTQTHAPPETPVCRETAVFPMLATDGDELSFGNTEVVPDQPVLLRGYRYNDAPPTVNRPEGEGRELIYCGCQRVSTVLAPGIDG